MELIGWYSGVTLGQQVGILGPEPLGKGFVSIQDQSLFIPALEPLGRSCKVICSLFLLVLGLEVLGRGYSVSKAD